MKEEYGPPVVEVFRLETENSVLQTSKFDGDIPGMGWG